MSGLSTHGIMIGAVALAVSLSAVGRAQTRSTRTPEALTIESLSGKDTFEAYCAPCHGRGGAGDGPVAPVLRTLPADLRVLSAKSGGVFPRAETLALLTGTGRSIPAHGTTDMPIWGAIFRMLDPSDARVRLRIENVVVYLASIQK